MFKNMAGVNSPVLETLQEIISYSEKLRVKAEAYRPLLRNVYPNLDAFRTITNNMFMVKELTKYYQDTWSKKREKLVRSDCEQINRLLTLMYVHCFMVAEFHIKELIKRSNCELFQDYKMTIISGKNEKDRQAQVYLSDIMKKSEGKIITKNERHVWDVLRKIRNAAVHNDCFFMKGDKATYKLGDEIKTIEYHKMDYLRGDLDLALTLIEILMELLHDWVENFLKLV
jgi:hypothetical protein